MRIRFIRTTKDIREGKTKFYKGIPKSGETHKPSEVAIDRELGEVYVKNGDAVELDSDGNTIERTKNEGIKIIEKAKKEEDGKV